MPRTTDVLVKGILLDDYGPMADGTLPDLTPFIDTAAAIMSQVEGCMTAGGNIVTPEYLEIMERWLAAHCYKQSDQAISSESITGASSSYQGQTGMYLQGTKYGQMALSLDFTGCLDEIASGPAEERGEIDILWLGKRESEKIPYWQRNY